MVLRPEEGVFEHLHDPAMDSGFFAFTAAGYVEALDSKIRKASSR